MNAGREILESWLEEPESAGQAELQQLAWYTIPYKGDGPRADLAEACAALLESTGRPRAAAAMRRHSPDVLAAWARSEPAGPIRSWTGRCRWISCGPSAGAPGSPRGHPPGVPHSAVR